MNPWSTVPEYSVEESEKIPLTEKLQDYTNQISLVQVQAELSLLSKELSISVDILGRILDSVRVLEQSLEEQQ